MQAPGGIPRTVLSGLLMVACLLALPSSAQPQTGARTDLNVVVTDAETGKPINQARLTLFFTEPHPNWKRGKRDSYAAKTNAQGHCRFALVPKGSIHLMVTAEQHESFGRNFEFTKDDQVIEVKLKKPQPLL